MKIERIVNTQLPSNLGRKCIIGGGSKFVEKVDKSLFIDQFIIGTNCWPLLYPCNWVVIGDTHLFLDELQRIYSEKPNVKVAAMKVKTLPDKHYSKAEIAWEPEYKQDFTDKYEGRLFLDFSGTAAIHLACLLGLKEILLFGVDYTDGENTSWFPHCDSYKNIDATGVNNNMRAIKDYYNVNVYQANANAKTDFPFMEIEDFIKKEE